MSDEISFRTAFLISESRRQDDIAAAKALTGADRQAAIASADRTHHARTVEAGIANGINCPNARSALIFDPILPERVDRTDETTFTLKGGRYYVAADGTFDSGTITLVDAGGAVRASFTEAGSAVVDLRFGTYNFALTDVTDLVASVRSAPYF